MKYFYEIVGWYGAAAIILAYFLNSYSVLASTSIVYQLLNLSGALGIVIVSVHKHTFQTVALNIVWSLIAAIAILKILA